MRKSKIMDILRFFALNQEVKLSNLPVLMNKTTNKLESKSAYHLALKHVNTLKKESLIREKEQLRSRHGKPSKIYEITTLGLVTFLAQEQENKNITELARTHTSHLPLIFGKWVFFEKEGILEQLLKNIKTASKYLLFNESWVIRIKDFERIQQLLEIRKQEENKFEESLKEIFPDDNLIKFKNTIRASWKIQDKIYKSHDKTSNPKDELINAFLGLTIVTQLNIERTDTAIFLESFRKDPEIKLYITKQLDKMVSDHLTLLKRTKQWRSWWISLP